MPLFAAVVFLLLPGCRSLHDPTMVGEAPTIRIDAPGSNPAVDVLSAPAGFDVPSSDASPDAPDSATMLRPARFEAVVDREAIDALVGVVDGASETVTIVEFSWSAGDPVDRLLDAVARAVERGVRVRVLLESELERNAAAVDALQAVGADARLDTSEATVHAKLVVADGERALVGSSNLSWSALESNHEANVLVDGGVCAAWLRRLADALWTDEHAATPPLPPAGVCRPYGPAGAVSVTEPAIDAAERRVLVLMYAFSLSAAYPDGPPYALLHALTRARARGVDVRVVLEEGASYAPVADVNIRARGLLEAGDIPVRFDGAEQITHAKLVVADDTVVVGSANWSYSGLATNLEAGVAIDDAALADALAAYAETVWAAGADD